jgi:hypothetical protein
MGKRNKSKEVRSNLITKYLKEPRNKNQILFWILGSQGKNKKPTTSLGKKHVL